MSEQGIYTLAHLGSSAKAIRCAKSHDKKDEPFWLPESQINIRQKKLINQRQWVVVAIPSWLAERCGLDASLDGDVLEGYEDDF